MAQRLAGAGAQAGFSSDEIMSVSAAMSSVGIEAEAGEQYRRTTKKFVA